MCTNTSARSPKNSPYVFWSQHQVGQLNWYLSKYFTKESDDSSFKYS